MPALGLFKVPQLNKQAMSQPTLDVSLEEYIMIDKKLKLFNNLHFIYEVEIIDCLFVCLICRYVALFRMWVEGIFSLFLI